MFNLSIRKSPLVALGAIALLVPGLSYINLASAQQTTDSQQTTNHGVDHKQHIDQAFLDNLLAPIALYPDSLLSQILVAATYPLELVQAARWRQANQSLTESQVLLELENKDWDPSIKALTPYTDLLVRLSEDLDWLQELGDAFLQNEAQVLSSVQGLRHQARDNNSINDNDYYELAEDNGNIIIEPTRRDVVYVPYYDTRVVYGPWRWSGHQPTYWHRPASHSILHAGFYWSDRFYVRPSLFFGGFRWSARHLVINPFYYDRPYQYQNRSKFYRQNIRRSDYRRWTHKREHRRGARYNRHYRNFNSGQRAQRNSIVRERARQARQLRRGNLNKPGRLNRRATLNQRLERPRRDTARRIDRYRSADRPQANRGDTSQRNIRQRLANRRDANRRATNSERYTNRKDANQHRVAKQRQANRRNTERRAGKQNKANVRNHAQRPAKQRQANRKSIKTGNTYRTQSSSKSPTKSRQTRSYQAKSRQYSQKRNHRSSKSNPIHRR